MLDLQTFRLSDLRIFDLGHEAFQFGRWKLGRWTLDHRWYVGTLGRWDVGTLGRWDAGRLSLDVSLVNVGVRCTIDTLVMMDTLGER